MELAIATATSSMSAASVVVKASPKVRAIAPATSSIATAFAVEVPTLTSAEYVEGTTLVIASVILLQSSLLLMWLSVQRISP